MRTISSPRSARSSLSAIWTIPSRLTHPTRSRPCGRGPQKHESTDAERRERLRLEQQGVDRVLQDSGQRSDRRRSFDRLADEHRRHEVVCPEAGLGHEPSHHGRLPQPSQSTSRETHEASLPPGVVGAPVLRPRDERLHKPFDGVHRRYHVDAEACIHGRTCRDRANASHDGGHEPATDELEVTGHRRRRGERDGIGVHESGEVSFVERRADRAVGLDHLDAPILWHRCR